MPPSSSSSSPRCSSAGSCWSSVAHSSTRLSAKTSHRRSTSFSTPESNWNKRWGEGRRTHSNATILASTKERLFFSLRDVWLRSCSRSLLRLSSWRRRIRRPNRRTTLVCLSGRSPEGVGERSWRFLGERKAHGVTRLPRFFFVLTDIVHVNRKVLGPTKAQATSSTPADRTRKRGCVRGKVCSMIVSSRRSDERPAIFRESRSRSRMHGEPKRASDVTPILTCGSGRPERQPTTTFAALIWDGYHSAML